MDYNNSEESEISKAQAEKNIAFRIEEPNFTQIPNVLFEKWLPHLKETELKVLLVIYRKTFGWQKTKDQISLTQIEKLTGSQKNKVIIAVNFLIEKKLITKKVTGKIGKQKTVYEVIIQKKITGSNLAPPPGAHLAPTKETKNTNKEKEINKEKFTASEDAIFLFDSFEKRVNGIRKERKLKEIRVNKTKAQVKAFDDLLKENDKDHILKVINGTFESDFWKDKMATPVFFKKQFTILEMQAVTNKKTSAVSNMVIAQDLYEKYHQSALRKNIKIEILSNEIEFIHTASSAQAIVISYCSKDFKEQLNNVRRKINLY